MQRSIFCPCLLVVAGCYSPQGAYSDEMPEDLPAGSCRDTDAEACASTGVTEEGPASTGAPASSSASTTEPTDDCLDSAACLGDGACVAPWDAKSGARGPFACQFACVPLLDEQAWCRDDASCCEPGAVCTARGYCILLESEGTSTGAGS